NLTPAPKLIRVGNQGVHQFSLDIFGHVLLAATQHYRAFGQLPPGLWPKLEEIAEYVCQAWRRPDAGPWELPAKPEHYVVSKALCWSALDCAIWLAHQQRLNIPPRWIQERKVLHHTICLQGYDSQRRTFIRSFGERELDAALLLL